MRPTVLITASLACAAAATIALAAAGERLARLNLEETQLSQAQDQNVSQLARLLSVLEQLKRDPPPALLVSPNEALDAVRAAILVKAMTPELQRRAQVYTHEAGEMNRQRRLAAVESEALFTNDSLKAEALPEAASAGVDLKAGDASGAALVPPQALLAPVSGKVIRRFGDPLNSGGRSNGLTYSTQLTARVASPGAGIVQYVGSVKGWGLILIIKLAGGYHLVLAGLDRASVTVGQSVAAGTPVGWMPDSRQSISELYLEVRQDGSPVDPGKWLKDKAG